MSTGSGRSRGGRTSGAFGHPTRLLARMVFTGTMLSLLSFGAVSGVPAQQGGDLGPSSLSETYSDWKVNCVQNGADAGGRRRSCEMVQELTQRETGKRFLVISLRPKGEGALVSVLAPFGLLLSDGIRVDFSEEALFSVPFHTCVSVGCIGAVEVPIPIIATLAAGDAVDVKMTGTSLLPGDGDDRDIRVTISLIGFTAAWNRVKTINQ